MPKASSGLTAVRQTQEDWLVPPIPFTIGATSFTSSVRDAKGQASAHVGVTNDTVFTLSILQAWTATGNFVQTQKVTATLDPVTGFYTADILCAVNRRFLKFVVAAGSGLGLSFEAGAYLMPRADSISATVAGGSGSGAAVPNRAAFITGQDNLTAHATPQKLNGGVSQAVPDGFSVFVTFKKSNTGANIYLAESSAKALAGTNCKIMNTQNAGIRLYVTDVSLIWIASDADTDGVDWIVER
jgi:hypothetical protein